MGVESVGSALTALARVSLAQRELIGAMVRRELAARYRGTALGWLWALAQPLVSLAIYTVVFGLILKVRWSQADDPLSFALVLFAGLMVYSFVADVLGRAPTLVVANPNFVKRVVFPLQVLVWQGVGAAAFQWAMNLLMWLCFYAVLQQQAHSSWLWLPVLVLPLLAFALGLGLALAALGVFLRDLAQAMTPLLALLLYLSPVFYSAAMVPPALAALMRWNPLALIIEPWRAALFGQLVVWTDVGLFSLWALGALALGAWLFERTRSGFADVL